MAYFVFDNPIKRLRSVGDLTGSIYGDFWGLSVSMCQFSSCESELGTQSDEHTSHKLFSMSALVEVFLAF